MARIPLLTPICSMTVGVGTLTPICNMGETNQDMESPQLFTLHTEPGFLALAVVAQGMEPHIHRIRA